jgi:hypothetical protein
MACASTPQPGVGGFYEFWDDVITRWIGQSKEALSIMSWAHRTSAVQLTDKQTELVWDMTIDRMPGQAVWTLIPHPLANLPTPICR